MIQDGRSRKEALFSIGACRYTCLCCWLEGGGGNEGKKKAGLIKVTSRQRGAERRGGSVPVYAAREVGRGGGGSRNRRGAVRLHPSARWILCVVSCVPWRVLDETQRGEAKGVKEGVGQVVSQLCHECPCLRRYDAHARQRGRERG